MTEHALDGAEVGAVGTDDEIVLIERLRVYLTGIMMVKRNAMAAERLSSRRVDVVAYLFGGDRHGVNAKPFSHAGLAAEVAKDKLCHGGAADVAMTYKENVFHRMLCN